MAKQKHVTAIEPLLLSIPEVAKSLGVSRSMVYKLIDVEGLPVVRFGRAVRVRVIALQQWVDQHDRSA